MVYPSLNRLDKTAIALDAQIYLNIFWLISLLWNVLTFYSPLFENERSHPDVL